ncbi:MAG: hypothetical protein NC311_06470 [Muribaculaceae bacterium]|nr:hypothetical protein [Muribaculaceae bacterium]
MDYAELIRALRDPVLEKLIATHQLFGEVDPCFTMCDISRQITIDFSNVEFEIAAINVSGSCAIHADRYDTLSRVEKVNITADIKPLAGSNMQDSLENGTLLDDYRFMFRNLEPSDRIMTIDAKTV